MRQQVVEKRRDVLLTGVTGYLGRYVLKYLLEDSPELHPVCLVRPAQGESPTERVREVAKFFDGAIDLSRVDVVEGEMSEPSFGLAPDRYAELARRVGGVIHCAASTKFHQELGRIRKTNVEGTRRVAEFSELCSDSNPEFRRLVHVSTAYVAGRRTGTVDEARYRGAEFKNNYERTKWEAEELLFENCAAPFVIARPSIIIGERGTGRARPDGVGIPAFEVLRHGSRDRRTRVPMSSRVRFDFVSVDFVAQALVAALQAPDIEARVLHVTAGKGNEVDGAAVLRLCNEKFGTQYVMAPYRPFVAYLRLHRWLFPEKTPKHVAALFDAYVDYVIKNPQFDNSNLQKLLEGSAVEADQADALLDDVLDYGIEHLW